ncbi:hypothetical protein B0T19DRAFT_16094 [Cercophora scortea]|uniref:Uncharacterized protein n=1 Tax=Cercophora scortea TaxID=314031 RepID=A0AAE0J2H1_9PEZI|nr:hypothetical protein B0T19DRAFT_16094 [Cercophora scortea]
MGGWVRLGWVRGLCVFVGYLSYLSACVTLGNSARTNTGFFLAVSRFPTELCGGESVIDLLPACLPTLYQRSGCRFTSVFLLLLLFLGGERTRSERAFMP